MGGIITKVKNHASSNLLGVLYHLFPQGKLTGREFEIGNVNGDPGNSLKFNVQSGVGKDFSADWAGDIVSLWAAARQTDQLGAAKQMAEWLGVPDDFQVIIQPPKIQKQKLQALIVPENAPPPPDWIMAGGVRLEFVCRWGYRKHTGELVGYVARFHYPEGQPNRFLPSGKFNKEIRPQVWTEKGWLWSGLATPTPLYGAELITTGNDLPILVVEGEKAADASRELIRSHIVVSFIGGAGGIKKTDWTPCHGRNVLLLPDSDLAGSKTMRKVQEILGGNAVVSVVKLPEGLSDGWDMADASEGGMQPELAEEMLTNLVQYDEFPSAEQQPATQTQPARARPPAYTALGYDHGKFFFLDAGGQVVAFTGPGLEQTGNLAQLDTINGWEMRVVQGKEGFGRKQALQCAGILIAECRARGVFDSTRTRGLGAWWDSGRSVFHAGDRLLVDGTETAIDRFPTRFFYEQSKIVRYSLKPAIAKDANQFALLCQALTWDKKVSGLLLAGWCVIAPICGALEWRPHIWITSSAGAGKSWIMKSIIRPVLGDLELPVLGSTTEAGLRQTLGADARPIIFDEAESESQRSAASMQMVLQLSRQASSDGNGTIVKGSATGQSVSFHIRSAFAYSSINTGIKQRADETRITVLGLRENTPEERETFKSSTIPLCQKVMTDDFCLRLRCRAVNNISTIRSNAVIFSTAVANRFGTQRQGDQLGALLAGAYLLYSKNIITQEKADQWVSQQQWDDPASMGQGIPDETKLLHFILERTERIRNDAKHDSSYSFSQLLLFASGFSDESHFEPVSKIMQRNAVDRLGQVGIKYHSDKNGQSFAAISSSNSQLKSLLADTPWGASWSRTLSRLPGAMANQQTRIGGKNARCTLIPLDTGKSHS